MFRLPLSVMSPAGRLARLSILIFHRVLDRADPLFPETPTAGEFEAQMRWVRSWFNVLPMDLAVDRLFAGTLPSRALCISFDDGYADNEVVAAPILERLGMTATFFVSTGFLDGGCMWNDHVIESIRGTRHADVDLGRVGLGRWSLGSNDERRRAILDILAGIKRMDPDRRQAVVDAVAELTDRPMPVLMMRPDQVRNLRDMGMSIGAHTVSHPILAKLDEDSARQEIARSRADLERILEEPVTLFAYPNGVPDHDYAGRHAQIVRECGFKAAVSTAWGSASMGSDRFQLPRFTPWDRSQLRYGARMLQNLLRTERVAA